jgi:hypothetical protein
MGARVYQCQELNRIGWADLAGIRMGTAEGVSVKTVRVLPGFRKGFEVFPNSLGRATLFGSSPLN